MRHIWFTQDTAEKIAEMKEHFEGTIEGYLTRQSFDMFFLTTVKKYDENLVKLSSGIKMNIRTNDGTIVSPSFNKEEELGTECSDTIDVVISLPLVGREVIMIDSETIKFKFECSNEQWHNILDSLEHRIQSRIDVELGIEDYISNVLSKDISFEIADKLEMYKVINIEPENRFILEKVFERRKYLFDDLLLKKKEVTAISLVQIPDEYIVEVGSYFIKPKEEEVTL